MDTKKVRTLLLLFSVAACASLVFANLGFQRTTEQIAYDAGTHWSGNSELSIVPRQEVGATEWIDPDVLTPWQNDWEYVISLIQGKALYAPDSADMHYFTVLGADIEDFDTYNPVVLESGNADNWEGNSLVLGQTFAQRLGVGVGDKIQLEINGETYLFDVVGIGQPTGLFLRELADGGYLLVPKETLAEIMGGECNLIFLKTNDASSVSELLEELTAALPQYAVKWGVDHAMIAAETTGYTMPFWFSSLTVIFMSVLIIYSSFNIVVNERIKILGILRSVGCTRRKTNRILLLESALVGTVGGALGCVLGTGVLYVIKDAYYSGEGVTFEAPMLVGVQEALPTIVVTILITVLCAMLPILKATKTPVKSMILNDYQKQKLKNARLWPLGILLLLPCAFIPGLLGKGFAGMFFATAVAMLALVGMNLLIPMFCRLAAVVARRVAYPLALGVRNAGDFKALVNSIRLFASVMAIMVFMMTLFNSMMADMRWQYQRLNYDIQLEFRETSSETLARLSQTEGVSGVCGVYETSVPEIKDRGTFLNALFGIDSPEYFEYGYAEISSETMEALYSLNDGQNIVTTNIMREKLGLNFGDTLTLKLENGYVDFQVTGFLETNYSLGYVGFISSENYRAATGVIDYSNVLVKTESDPDMVKSNIQRAFSQNILSIQTKSELEAANADKVESIFNSINIYAYFAMLIGILGIANNVVACYLGRRRNIALYRCVGMSVRDTKRMLLTEAATIGIVGVLAGLGTGAVMMRAVPFVVGMLWGNISVVTPFGKLAVLCIAGVGAMLLCSLIPLVKGKNITIMDNIRYE